jgi:tripartite-type tricarboxylate transporter receptor subunit TctC
LADAPDHNNRHVPAGSTGIVARIVADRLSGKLGWQMVVDQRPGAGGTVGARQVARSAPEAIFVTTATNALELLLLRADEVIEARQFGRLLRVQQAALLVIGFPAAPRPMHCGSCARIPPRLKRNRLRAHSEN